MIAYIGTGLWAVALVVVLIVGPPAADRWWLWVCVVGVGIGLFGVWYIPRLHRSRAALEARRAASKPAASKPVVSETPGSETVVSETSADQKAADKTDADKTGADKTGANNSSNSAEG